MTKLVTRDSLKTLLEDPIKRPHVIGRALVVLFNNQTRDEQSSNATNRDNDIGFAGCDAYQGSLTAKYYLKHGKLLDWQVTQWMRNFRGYPRICKYHAQLNRAATVKKQLKAA